MCYMFWSIQYEKKPTQSCELQSGSMSDPTEDPVCILKSKQDVCKIGSKIPNDSYKIFEPFVIGSWLGFNSGSILPAGKGS